MLQSDSLSVMKHGGSVRPRAICCANKVAENDSGRWYEILVSDGRSNVSVLKSAGSEHKRHLTLRPCECAESISGDDLMS